MVQYGSEICDHFAKILNVKIYRHISTLNIGVRASHLFLKLSSVIFNQIKFGSSSLHGVVKLTRVLIWNKMHWSYQTYLLSFYFKCLTFHLWCLSLHWLFQTKFHSTLPNHLMISWNLLHKQTNAKATTLHIFVSTLSHWCNYGAFMLLSVSVGFLL